MTCGPLVGSLRKGRRDDLYEQCSFHIAETMPSSVKVGVRPISATSRAYSSGLSPCATASVSSTFGSVSLKGLRLSVWGRRSAFNLAPRRPQVAWVGPDREARSAKARIGAGSSPEAVVEDGLAGSGGGSVLSIG